jgi:hypothetical protein
MIVFLHIPKTAGSTFQFILENTFGVSACHTNHTKKKTFEQVDFDFARKVFPRLSSIAGHNLINPLHLSVPDPFYITFLREPVMRVISQYQDSVDNGNNRASFEESLRSGGVFSNLHVKLMAGEENLDKAKAFLDKCGFVGLTEKFDLSLHVLDKLSPRKLNLVYKKKRIPQKNSIKQTLTKDPAMLALAREHNRLDIELYDYAANEIFPRLCAKAGFRPSDQVPSLEKYAHELRANYLLSNLYNMAFYRQLCKFA